MLALNITANLNPFIGRGATYDNSNAIYFSSGHYYDENYIGLYKSVDNGSTWTILNSTKTLSISAVTRDSSGSIYISLSGGVIKKSSDSGVTWSTLPISSDTYPSNALDSIISGTPKETAGAMTWNSTAIFALCGGNIWKSTDAGLTWKCVMYSASTLWTICATDDIVFAAGDNGLACKSTDGGITWNSIAVLLNKSWRTSCANGNTIYLGVANEYIYTSTDNLNSIHAISNTAQNWQSSVVLPDGTLYVGVYGSHLIYKSSVIVGGLFASFGGQWLPVVEKYVYLNGSWVKCGMNLFGNSKWN